jgi:glycosyltransferase involved in cell wall biosynthesis
MHQLWVEKLFEFRVVQWFAAGAFLARGACLWILGRRYRAVADFCWIMRVTAKSPFHRAAERVIFRVLKAARETGINPLVEYYRADPASQECASLYSITGQGKSDLWRDLIVLKQSAGREKGVILLKYGRTFNAVAALFDIRRLMDSYTVVLEPCWAGYCDPGILMFYTPGQPVPVQCFTDKDHDFIVQVGAPFLPIRLGPADWVDAEVFGEPPPMPKIYDVVMVANWSVKKRHAVLFRALRKVVDRDIKLLLVGFPWAGRSADDIRREASRWLPANVQLEIVESVPHARLSELLRQSRVFVFLSKKEGDNKSLVEAMFADVPAIVYDSTIGGASSRINPATGLLSSERELASKIVYVLDHTADFAPRRWALDHTGSAVATRTLDEALRDTAMAAGASYVTGIVEKINGPNLAYKHLTDRQRFAADYEFILSCRRKDTSS